MKSIKEIRDRLTSENLDVLNMCDNFLNQKLEMERLRGESAEKRANIILGTVGASSAFLVFLAGVDLDTKGETASFAIIIYIASILWLTRAIWYSIKSIRTQNRYHVTEDSVFEFQEKSQIDTIKEIIAGKIWEYKYSVQPNTERLFYVQRAQRALVVFIGLLLLLGVVIISENKIKLEYVNCLKFAISFSAVIFWIFGDWLIEKKGIWNHN